MITILLEKVKDLLIELKTNIENIPSESNIIYSTEEKVIGKWINGNDLYQKTLVFQAPSTRDYTQHPLGVSVDYATVYESAIIKNGQIGVFNGDYDGSPANDEWQGFINKTNSSFDFRVGANYLNANIYLTIHYTKSST